jgi:hypothetical protein
VQAKRQAPKTTASARIMSSSLCGTHAPSI